MAETIVIGIGNPIASDDGAGVRAVRELKTRLADSRVRVVECERGGLDLLDHLLGLRGALLVDASRTGCRASGAVEVFTLSSPYAPDPSPSLHTIDLAGVLAFGEAMAMPLPREVHVVTVEAEDIETFCESCTPAVAAAIPEAVETLIRLLRRGLPDLKTVSPRRPAEGAGPAAIPA